MFGAIFDFIWDYFYQKKVAFFVNGKFGNLVL